MSNRHPYICRFVHVVLEGTSSQGAVWGCSSIKRLCPLRGSNPDLISCTASSSSSTYTSPRPHTSPRPGQCSSLLTVGATRCLRDKLVTFTLTRSRLFLKVQAPSMGFYRSDEDLILVWRSFKITLNSVWSLLVSSCVLKTPTQVTIYHHLP